jgi:hypothetical protein
VQPDDEHLSFWVDSGNAAEPSWFTVTRSTFTRAHETKPGVLVLDCGSHQLIVYLRDSEAEPER